MTAFLEAVDSIQSPQTTRQPIPAEVMSAPVVLGYIAGNSWPTYVPYAKARPELARSGRLVSVTLTCLARARVYDIEPGGGENRNIGVFMRNADHSHGLPWLYTFAANGRAMLDAAAGFGYRQGRDFYYLSSHAGAGRHICGPHTCGFPQADGTQYEFDHAFDRSVIPDYMLGPVAKPKPAKPDPHYERFDDTIRHLGGSRHGSERQIVAEYDRERAHWKIWPRRLRVLRQDCAYLARRLDTLLEEEPRSPLAAERKWRRAQLQDRAAGKRVV